MLSSLIKVSGFLNPASTHTVNTGYVNKMTDLIFSSLLNLEILIFISWWIGNTSFAQAS